jgi:glycosyltransferase involved in cell wall biosynthesis
MIQTLNITQANIIEKGLSTILIEYLFLRAIKKYFSEVHFDLVLYSTPPITFAKVIQYIKNRDNALSYLLLKDIFPQNAVDLKMIRKGGLLHRYFRKKEKELYSISDFIGCMSQANVDFIRKNNPEINPDKLEINPNSIEPIEFLMSQNQKFTIRDRYKIPVNTTVFILGGSLGKPQGIGFLIEVLDFHLNRPEVFFIIVGSGNEHFKIKSWFEKQKPKNALLLSFLAKDEYDLLLQASDVGLIFLDRQFTVPNFPSRLLPYLENKMPVIAATDKNTDLGKIMEDNAFGLWSEAGDIQSISHNILTFCQNKDLLAKMGQNGYSFMLKNYTVSNSYQAIIRHFTRN